MRLIGMFIVVAGVFAALPTLAQRAQRAYEIEYGTWIYTLKRDVFEGYITDERVKAAGANRNLLINVSCSGGRYSVGIDFSGPDGNRLTFSQKDFLSRQRGIVGRHRGSKMFYNGDVELRWSNGEVETAWFNHDRAYLQVWNGTASRIVSKLRAHYELRMRVRSGFPRDDLVDRFPSAYVTTDRFSLTGADDAIDFLSCPAEAWLKDRPVGEEPE